MIREQLYLILDNAFADFQLFRVEDINLNFVDTYYTNTNEDKYIIICKLFKDKTDLISNWEKYQDADIALYLQQNKYAKMDVRWDMYFLLLYTGKEDFNDEEFHKIEKDRFCCKKFIINARDKVSINDDFNRKLPFTSNYYDLGKLTETITDNEFLNLLRQETKLSRNTVPDDVLSNLTKNKDKVIKGLMLEERGTNV